MTAIVDTSAGLAAFVRTIETGSFSDAARLLGASPSAVSKSVARLEARLGVRLIQRSTRTLALTAEGALYFERVAPLIQALADAEQALRTPDDVSGLLRVAAPSDLGRTVFAGWAERFARAHPRLKLELGIADRQVDLIREGYDVAIRVGALLDNRLTARRLTVLQPVLVAAPAYLARCGQPAERADLAEHACLRYLTPAGPFPWTWADGSSLVPDGPFDTNDGVVLRQARGGGRSGRRPPRHRAAAPADARAGGTRAARLWTPGAAAGALVHCLFAEAICSRPRLATAQKKPAPLPGRVKSKTRDVLKETVPL
jgi:DNA-binding transcriptional LysR family regulator